MPAVDPPSLEEAARAAIAVCAGWSARLAARRITQFLDQEMGGIGLSLAQFGLLAQIAAVSDTTLGALAQQCGLDPSTLSRNLRTLEAEGLVEIAPVESDLRRRTVRLSPTGIARFSAALPVWQAAHDQLASRMSPALARKLALETEALVAD